ncbi:protein FAM83H-like [Petromyzon marinus]|uniref:protein FAM83H-like n=1 Tax=Petromyzon marinus TaxID=7757 RepID=UPI003F6EA1B6
MARPSQQSSVFDDGRDRDRLPPHYKESYRLAIDVLVEQGRDAFREFLQREGTVPFLSEQEVDHIERTFQSPAVTTRGDDGDEVGQDFGSSSSGTYWPVYSDTSAPDLELGWPAPGRFLGQTNVTLHFHPPLGNGVPTIKEVIRRHIRGASKVVAVVMDVFTDVDIFQELLEAANVRRVPVYVLHDRLNFPLFHDMCLHHGLRAGELENVRVRTLPGSLYFCKSGAKFHGQVFEKFMLFDCITALCGSYSLTWSHEKIHRSLVHEFTGEMVETFDEEFRVLYAQSSCPYDDSSAVAIPGQVPPPTRGLEGLRGLRGAPHLGLALQIEKHDSSVDSWVSSTSSRRALDRQTLNFTHHDFARRPIDNTYARVEAKHLHREDRYTFTAKQEVLSEKEYRGVANVSQRFVANAQVFAGEKEVWKRYSYAGEATESHSFLQRMQDPYSFASGRGALEPRPRNIGGVLPGQEFRRLQAGAGAYGDRFGEGRGEDVFGDDGAAFPDFSGNAKRITAAAEEEEARDISQQQQLAPYNQRKRSEFPAQHLMNSRREAWQGQPGKADGGRSGAQQTFACQTSPTQTQSFQEEGPFAKAGAASRAREGDAGVAEKSAKQGLRRWRINSFLSSCENPAEAEAGGAEDDPRPDGEARSGEGRGSPAADAAVAGFADGLTRHESLRSKISPMLQRNSRLRSSLIFNSARQDAGGSEPIAKRGPGNSGGGAAAADDKPPAGPRRADEVAAEAPAGGSSNAAESKEKDAQAAVALPASDLQSKYAPREPFVRSRFLFSSLTNRKAATATAEEEVRAASDKVGPVARPDSHIKELFPKPQPLAEGHAAPAGSAVSKANPSPGSEQTKFTQIQQRNETIPARSKSSSSSAADTGAQVTRGATDSAAQEVKPDPASGAVSRASAERASRLQELLDKANNKKENPPEKTSTVNATLERASPREPCRPSAPPAASPTSAKAPPAQEAASGGVSRAPATIGTSELSPSPAWRSSSTSTPVLYGSNLKDDTKVMLEQISLSSHKYKDDNHKAMQENAQGDDSARLPRDAAGGGGSSVASPKEAAPSQASPTTTALAADEDRSDELIRNLESKRKENRAYSRFEVFYKSEGTEAKPKGISPVVSPVVSPVNVPDQSRYVPDRYRAMEQPLSNSLLQKIKVTFKGKN